MNERYQEGFDLAAENFIGEVALGSDWRQAEEFIRELVERNRAAWETTPDEAGDRATVSAQSGISQDMLEDAEVLKDVKIRTQMKRDALALQYAPYKVSEWFRYPGALALARDDIEVFSALEGALRQLAIKQAPSRVGGWWDYFRTGVADQLLTGWADVNEALADNFGVKTSSGVLTSPANSDDLRRAFSDWGVIDEKTFQRQEENRQWFVGLLKTLGFYDGAERAFAQWGVDPDTLIEEQKGNLRAVAETERRAADWVRPTPYLRRVGPVNEWVGDFVASMPYTLSGMIPSAALTVGGSILGGPLGAVVGAGLASLMSAHGEAQMEQVGVYKQLVEQGMDKAEAYDKTHKEVYLPNVGILFASNFIQNRLTFGALSGKNPWVKGGKKALELLASSLFEGGEEVSQALISNSALGVENDVGALAYEGSIGFASGLLFGLGGASIRVAADKIIGNVRAELESEETERLLSSLDEAKKTAEMSKVLARTPETFEDFIEHVTKDGQGEVYVDSDFFRQALGEEAAATAQALDVFDQFEESENTGADLSVKISKLLSYPGIYDKIREDIKFSMDGMTRRQAEEYRKTRTTEQQKAAEEGAQVLQYVKDAGASAAKIKEEVKARYLGLEHEAIGEREAEAYSTVYTAWVLHESDNWGVTPEDFHKQVNLQLEYDRTEDSNPPGTILKSAKAADARYFAAIEAGDMETAQRIVDAKARKNGYISTDEYRISHRAPNSHSEDGLFPNLANVMESEIVPKDYWTTPSNYLNGENDYKAFDIITRAMKSPEQKITMYRAIPKGTRETAFRNGDWVTPLREVAKAEGDLTNAPYKILSQEVDLSDVWWDGDTITAFGYDDGKNYIYRDTKNNRKLNDVVVRDNDGNIVPPSKRFNFKKREPFYQYAGEEAQTADRLKLSEAEAMTETGTPNDEIRQKTGWFKGMDGKWRFEIPDNLDKINFDVDWTNEVTLGKIYDNPALYRAYPELSDIPVFLMERRGGEEASYSSASNEIALYGINEQSQKALIHEIQHAIQAMEGFARGGSVAGAFLNKNSPAWKMLEERRRAILTPMTLEEYARESGFEDVISAEDSYAEYLKDHKKRFKKGIPLDLDLQIQKDVAYSYYYDLAGEIEARDTSMRRWYSEEERQNTPPNLQNDAIVVFDGKEMHYQSQAQGGLTYGEKLHQDEKSWGQSVDQLRTSGVSTGTHIKVMTTPLVFHLAGAKVMPVYMNDAKVFKILQDHPGMTWDLIKQIPSALADPIAVFTSKSTPDSLVAMLELRDTNGATIVGALHLDVTQHTYTVNQLASAYGKDSVLTSTPTPKNTWFIDELISGRLRYIDTNKISQWLNRTGLQLPAGTTIEKLKNSIPTEADLVNARETYDGYYQNDEERIVKGATAFPDGQTIVRIFQAGDRSTFLHEMGHVFLEFRRRLITLNPDAPAKVREDWAKILKHDY
jgi:hypothetical protein